MYIVHGYEAPQHVIMVPVESVKVVEINASNSCNDVIYDVFYPTKSTY